MLKVTVLLSLSTCMHCLSLCDTVIYVPVLCVSDLSHLSWRVCDHHGTRSARLCAYLNVSLCLCLAVCPYCLYAQLIDLSVSHIPCLHASGL